MLNAIITLTLVENISLLSRLVLLTDAEKSLLLDIIHEEPSWRSVRLVNATNLIRMGFLKEYRKKTTYKQRVENNQYTEKQGNLYKYVLDNLGLRLKEGLNRPLGATKHETPK